MSFLILCFIVILRHDNIIETYSPEVNHVKKTSHYISYNDGGNEDHSRFHSGYTIYSYSNNITYGHRPLILLWNTKSNNRTVICGNASCDITSQKSHALHAAAIMFNAQGLSSIKDLPNAKGNTQVWILLLLDAPQRFKSDLSFLGGLINWTSSYNDDVVVSDIAIPYGRYHMKVASLNMSLLSTETRTVGSLLYFKRRMVAWIVSECRLPRSQSEVINQLQKLIPVDVFGPCRSLDCGDQDRCLEMLRNHYKFYLAFEKVSCRNYITGEFWFVALQHDIIPIVMGLPREDYEKVAPPQSFIHIDDFQSISALAKYLYKVSNDINLYQSYFEWKRNGFVSFRNPWPVLGDAYWCDLCFKLHNKPKRRRIRWNIHEWWNYETQCGIYMVNHYHP